MSDRLNKSQLQLERVTNQRWRVVVEEMPPIDVLLKADYWSNCSQGFGVGDEVVVIDAELTQKVNLTVKSSGRNWAVMLLDGVIKYQEVAEVSDTVDTTGFEVKGSGRSGYRVVRVSDGLTIGGSYPRKSEAQAALEQHLVKIGA